MKLGAISGCHQKPNRSFFWGKYQFPLCARCTGIFIGYLIGIMFSCVKLYPCKNGVLLCVPMALDGLTQYWGWRESNQILRFFTGIFGGIGIIIILIQMIGVIM